MKQTKYKFINIFYKQYCQNIQIFQDYDHFWVPTYKKICKIEYWNGLRLILKVIKSYIEMFENKMWQNLVEINEISNDK